MTIEPGQVYRAVRATPGDPQMTHQRLRVLAVGLHRAKVLYLHTGRRGMILLNSLHVSPTTKTGRPRRTGYALETK
jgi:hypothetical protein